MNLKKILSGFLAAAMAVTTMVTATFNASAEDIILKQMSAANIPVSELTGAVNAKITFDITEVISSANTTLTVFVNGDPWKQETYATSAQYAAGAGQDWQAQHEVTATGEQVVTLPFNAASWGYEIGIKVDKEVGFSATLKKIEFLKEDGSVVATYDPATPVISKDNFTYSTYKNIAMEIGDTFTITFNSVVNGTGIPQGAKFDFKYKIPKFEGASNDQTDFDYYAPVLDSEVNGTEGQEATGLKVTSETSGTTTVFTFKAVSATQGEFPFMINIETKVDGVTGYLGFTDDMGYKVVAATEQTITVDSTIENGAITVANAAGTTVTKAAENDVITVTAAPAEGYVLDKITVTDESDSAVPVTMDTTNTNKGTFTMPGKAVTVTATFKTAEVALTGITLNKTTATVLVGGTTTLTASKVPSTTTDTTPITWSSNKEDIATVSATGVVTGVAAGTAVITATCGEKTATCTVTVSENAIECTGITLNKTTATVEKNATVTLTATTTPADTTDDITWASSDTSIATVEDGVVTGKARGTADITVSCGTKSATCKVSVNEEETLTAPSSSAPAKTFSSAVTDGKYNENDVFVISAADVAAAKSVKVTVIDNNGKKTERTVTDCYKKVTYTAADGTTDTITAGANFLLAVTVTGIPEGTTVTVSIAVNK